MQGICRRAQSQSLASLARPQQHRQAPFALHRALRASRTFAADATATTTPPPPPPPKPSSPYFRRLRKAARFTGLAALSAVGGVLALGAGIFIHDAFTYTDQHVDRVPVNPLALHPERGGPKNLPIISHLVDDEEDEEQAALSKKPKLVIVGAGWGVCIPLSKRWSIWNGMSISQIPSSRPFPC
jgi:hypothetical protein